MLARRSALTACWMTKLTPAAALSITAANIPIQVLTRLSLACGYIDEHPRPRPAGRGQGERTDWLVCVELEVQPGRLGSFLVLTAEMVDGDGQGGRRSQVPAIYPR